MSLSYPIAAQIVTDTTLPNDSSVTTQGSTQIINGGTRAGNNLFHSFEQFSLSTGHTAYFNNALDIQNIISRITGKSVSNIDGLLRTNGAANLFLINPNGIVFGSNARLDVGGSFLASTASSLKFADAKEYSATAPQTTPLLIVSAPIGLKLNNNPGEIRVRGAGNNLAISSLFSPVSGAGASSKGLRVLPGKTLALIGGNIALEGGNLTAPGGRVELGSVVDGTVSINPTTSGWVFGYQGLQNFQDIVMSKQALVDSSGSGNSAIQLVGKQIFFTEGSLVLIQNQGDQAGSGVNIKASNLLKISGISSDGTIPSGVEVETLGGSVGDVVVSTKSLSFEDGAVINSKAFTETSASNIVLNASESIEIKGFSLINPISANIASGVGTYTFSTGKSGNITINTGQLTALDGGTVISGTFSSGTGGDLIINANRSIELSGFIPILFSPSQIAVGTYNSGNSGNLKINSPEIRLQNGGFIASYTFSSGNAGSITIEAPNFINITTLANTNDVSYEFLSGISSYAVVPPPLIQKILGLSYKVSGDASDIKIKTAQLSLSRSSIAVSNLGSGLAGKLDISANKVFLTNDSSISAVTASGNGGNIFLKANQVLLSDESTISATASNLQEALRLLNIPSNFSDNLSPNGFGIGGNITIDTDILTASNKSAITANAFLGQGGNIRINTQGLLISPDTRITASSERGIDGTVEINFQDRNPSQTKVQPEAIAQTPEVASVCQGRSGSVASKFVNVGTGGLPASPKKQVYSNFGWQENSIPQSIDNSEQPKTLVNDEPTKIVEAQGWMLNSSGDVVLTAEANPVTANNSLSARSCSTANSEVKND
ncbi:filamentous hemagglutinin N-terminal domain-containing protein [Dendronalium sp. ChiSLP03b]|uniref:two-partner secretion domain-containing protein n=1 Tax=Dendronalium sp. ChiSLP03b TaxID=3075381 RepID=UPI002ADA7FCA|nr:filamentous hemagglutinin N-terminal domain-containing protein [Dendronalium sp. ChiSLP03b]